MNSKPICILIDTNTWRKTLLLNSALGSALLYTINSLGAKIVLPEIVEIEIEKHILNLAKEAKANIEKGFRELGAIMGDHHPYKLPSNDDILEAIAKKFEKISPLLIKVPFTLSHAKNALERVNNKLPPSSTKQQQFKDSAIWEAVLELGKDYDLYFVTNDGDFFEDKSRSELNQKLKKECDTHDIKIHVYSDLELCLKGLKNEAPDIDYHLIATKIHELIDEELNTYASNNNIRVASIKEKSITALITEEHDQLAIQFDIIFDAMDVGSNNEEHKINPFMHVSGNCLFLVSTKKALDANLNRMEVHWETITGEKKQAATVYLTIANTYIGTPPAIPHTVRKKI